MPSSSERLRAGIMCIFMNGTSAAPTALATVRVGRATVAARRRERVAALQPTSLVARARGWSESQHFSPWQVWAQLAQIKGRRFGRPKVPTHASPKLALQSAPVSGRDGSGASAARRAWRSSSGSCRARGGPRARATAAPPPTIVYRSSSAWTSPRRPGQIASIMLAHPQE